MAEIGLVHLVWAPLGAAPLERFLRSYTDVPPGHAHRLLLVLNGFGNGPLPREIATVLADAPSHEVLRLQRRVQDLAAYRLAAVAATWARELCFMNSHARALVGGWLAMLHERLNDPGVGVVGATGTYESMLTDAPRPLKPLRARHFPPFPNPHLRTNGFMLRRADMLAITWRTRRTKWSAHRLESGGDGITNQLRRRGLEPRVVDRDGRAHAIEAWPSSRTYRSGAQERLLIADNRTQQYASADWAERRRLARMAWGDAAVIEPEQHRRDADA